MFRMLRRSYASPREIGMFVVIMFHILFYLNCYTEHIYSFPSVTVEMSVNVTKPPKSMLQLSLRACGRVTLNCCPSDVSRLSSERYAMR
ncbi:hypothetical protein PBCV1_a070L [Paramecium bursaria Chlorella virus 1]|uniref:Uncharacterized protein n=1 Tax=Paramecium bursaria Chlorella virus 1 TaxID=10506 RepID=Q89405_PBCV1|nr:hypothetical protein PBCV1_a070L [Paramecium bursaria Chlorella virus 1]AAC96438.1 hypothetical protein [Paramecium bursaria Chlorella virus 1]